MALPSYEYELGAWKTATVQMNYHIEVEKQFYSVPYTYAGQKVDVRISASCVEIFKDNIRICSHPRSFGKPTATSRTPITCRPPQEILEWDGERFLGWAEKIGLPRAMSCRPYWPPQGGAAGLPIRFGLLKLAERFSAVRLEMPVPIHRSEIAQLHTSAACSERHGQAEILPSNRLLPDHENIRGPEYYAERR